MASQSWERLPGRSIQPESDSEEEQSEDSLEGSDDEYLPSSPSAESQSDDDRAPANDVSDRSLLGIYQR